MAKARELLGKNIKRLREAKQWTQADLAEAADLSVKMIQKIEYGKTSPSTETLDVLVKHLSTTHAELFGGARQSTTQSRSGPDLLEAARVLGALAGVGPVRRAIVMYMLFQDEAYLQALPEIAPIRKLLSKVP